MQDLLYVGLSFVFVFFVIGLSTLFSQWRWLDEKASRKFVHIGVSHWILFILLFDQLIFALIPPIAFVLLNYLSYQKNIFKSMERTEKGNLGTIYFPISLSLVVLFTYLVGENKEFAPAAIAGILVLGYGDGLAAIIGKRFGKRPLINGKTFAGSLTLFITSILVLVAITWIWIPEALLVAVWWIPLSALILTVIELITPFGLDNISLPLVTTLLVWGMMLV